MGALNNHATVAGGFASIAQEFCTVIESAPNLDRVEFLLQIYKILPKLISEAIAFPDVELSDDEDLDKTSSKWRERGKVGLGRARSSEMYEFFKAKLADFDLYWEVWDPTKDHEVIRGSLADDFVDIYGDLIEGLKLSESLQAPSEDNVWHWRLGYYSHWGKHAIDALRTIHFLLKEKLSL